MPISSSGNASLDKLSSSYQSDDSKKSEKSDDLGRDAFLTMLVAQLQNQDPLNPMDGTDFSAQLAQFSQLEQLMNLNDGMESLTNSFDSDSDKDLISYVGKQVTGDVDTMQVKAGEVSGGFFSLSTPADVVVEIVDSSGMTVKRLGQGTKDVGSHVISWDGTNEEGTAVDDGAYTFNVLANTGSGYNKVSNSVTGTVDGVAYSDGKAYLVVQGILMDAANLTSVRNIQDDSTPVNSAMDYLGKTITSSQPIIEITAGTVQGGDLSFQLEKQEAVKVNVFDVFDKLVRTIEIDADNTTGGDNTVTWDGIGDDGFGAANGLYYYKVQSDSGTAKISVKEEVSGIKKANNTQFLVLKDSGRLVSLSSITGVDN